MELEGSQPQLRTTPRELGQSVNLVPPFQSDVEKLQAKSDQDQIKLEAIAARLDEAKAELQRSCAQLAATELALAQLQHHVNWMETSKFWKFRGQWLRFRDITIAPFKALPTLVLAATVRATLFLEHRRWYGLAKMLINTASSTVEPKALAKIAAAQSGRFRSSYCFAEPPDYADWIAAFEPDVKALKRQKADALLFPYQPVLSVILPVYKLPLSILQETLGSVFRQTYTNWELCIAFADASAPATERYLRSLAKRHNRIKLSVMPLNLGIAGNSNEAARLASGDFVVLLDHDDTLADFAFYEIVKTLNQQPDLDFIYSDKDCISENGAVRSRLLLKPQWSPEILYSVNYLTHLCVIRRELFTRIGGFRSETDGAQDWDLFFRVAENTSRIARTEGVLYHWRIIQGSTALSIASKPYAVDAQLHTVQSHLNRSGLQAKAIPHTECGFHVQWDVPAATATILVDGDVAVSTLAQCLKSLSSTLNPVLHKVCVILPEVTNHNQQEKSLLEQIGVPVTWVYIDSATSKLEGFADAAKQNPADVITVVSGQISYFKAGWIQELSEWLVGQPAIGFASALVVLEAGCVAEAGLAIDRDGNGAPLMRGDSVYFGGALWYRNCSASSPWAVMFRYEQYLEVGGLPTNESSLRRSIIKLCQAVCINGKRGLVNPHARVFLKDLTGDDVPEFHASLADDPYFHPAFGSVIPLNLKVKDGET